MAAADRNTGNCLNAINHVAKILNLLGTGPPHVKIDRHTQKFSGRKPGSTFRSSTKLRTIRPAPVNKKTKAMANSPAIRVLRTPRRGTVFHSLLPADTVPLRAAGQSPEKIAANSDKARVNNNAGPSRRASARRGIPWGPNATTAFSAAAASAIPNTPPLVVSESDGQIIRIGRLRWSSEFWWRRVWQAA